ncbi:MAG: HisA/HisF-related TIM barrel protein [Candidatus Cyclobacteriaceae bacterium M3_2C_046]
MIQIIPSITLMHGKLVKTIGGDLSREKVYEGSPVDVAQRFEDHGIQVVHLVDLEGATAGTPKNYHVLEAIASHTNLKVDFTGGILTDGDITKAFEYGATYITVASAAVLNKELFSSWVISYGREKITLGADSLDKKIAIKGWQKSTQIDLFEHISFYYDHGLKYVKTTDISRDGLMEGPAFQLYQDIQTRFPNICILASGGVRSVKDIEQLNDMGVFAVIIGRAIYEGKLHMEDLKPFLKKR